MTQHILMPWNRHFEYSMAGSVPKKSHSNCIFNRPLVVLIPLVKCIFLLWSSQLYSFRSLINSFLVTLWSGLYSIRFVLSSLKSGLLRIDIYFPSFFIFSPSSPLWHQAPAGGFPEEHWRPPSFTTLFVQKHQTRLVPTEVLVPGVRPLY